ncbi:hypothetical protein GGR54DRAFT_644408 [Hypoxylon sp. NC1633]|nr:hypothetical protein GGR54DRAFT_644408 [Hypoxylon sp. NC1633]
MSNLGPLTTIFTPTGPDCTSSFIGLVDDNLWLQYGVGAAASHACLPTGFIPFESYFYSPGICPSGYTSACQAQSSPSTGTASQTEATCCPSAYSCRDNRGDDPFGCLSCFEGLKTFSVSTYYFHTNAAGSTTQIDAGTTIAVVSANCVRAYGPVVRVAPGDIFITTTASTTSTSSSSSPTSRTVSTVVALTAPPSVGDEQGTESSPSGGLSAGAAAGIGTGCGLGAILLTGAAVLLWLRRRKRSAQNLPTAQPQVTEGFKLEPGWPLPIQQTHPYELSPQSEPRLYELHS